MGRPRAGTNRTSTPERLLQAAEVAFSAVGFGTAKLADIAQRAGIRRPSLLYHFASKEDLYAATVERCIARLRRALSEVFEADGDFTTRLMQTTERYVEFVQGEPELSRLVLRELLDGNGPGQKILLRQIVPLVDDVERFIRTQGKDVVRPDVPVRAAVLMMASDVFLRSATGPLKQPLWGEEDHAKSLARILLLHETPDQEDRQEQ
ncbi:MAG: TetR/AcrR family transcriptional regulator [Nannocystaceae bacterium]|nr:TetR/AcrR family transcriptional regulator [Nannocystaceae bacterium]